MTPETRRTALAAAIIFFGFAIAAYFLPSIMLALGDISPWLAGLFAILFVAAFFAIFWLRGLARNRE
jgi:hypothetical protein